MTHLNISVKKMYHDGTEIESRSRWWLVRWWLPAGGANIDLVDFDQAG